MRRLKNKGVDLIQRRNWRFKAICFITIVLLFLAALFVSTLDNAPRMTKQNLKDTTQTMDAVPIRFERNTTAQEQETDSSEPLPYTEEDLYMMSHLIGAEAGETEKSRQLVGLVVLNRMNSDDSNFPDTMEEVIFQRGQYACTWDGNYEKEPNEDEIESAKKVLSGDTDYELAPEVIFQSTSKLGVVHEKVWSEVMQNWTYFCAPY